MSERIVRFSRLLRIFDFYNNPSYIFELEENNQKTLYISFGETVNNIRRFESYNESTLKEEFKDLSDHCLMSQCTDASYMFTYSHITHFEANCSNVVNGNSMFYKSNLSFINTEFPSLEYAKDMFSYTKIKEMMINFPKLKNGFSMFCKSPLSKITTEFPMLERGQYMFRETELKEIMIDFPKLKNGEDMFYNSPLEKITSKFPLLENGNWFFKKTPLKEINCQFPKIKDLVGMFDDTPPELRQHYPHYFI